MKFLLWGVICFVVVMWLLRTKSTPAKMDGNRHGSAPDTSTGEPMIRCAQCGIHIPASEAIAGQSGTFFCSDEHRLQYFPR